MIFILVFILLRDLLLQLRSLFSKFSFYLWFVWLLNSQSILFYFLLHSVICLLVGPKYFLILKLLLLFLVLVFVFSFVTAFYIHYDVIYSFIFYLQGQHCLWIYIFSLWYDCITLVRRYILKCFHFVLWKGSCVQLYWYFRCSHPVFNVILFGLFGDIFLNLLG